MSILTQSLRSIGYFTKLVASGSLHTSKEHLKERYGAPDHKTYAVFCETFSDQEYREPEVTLIIGFRLKFIRSSKLMHWIFQHICILDTPIWVGFKGFKRKFWMVQPTTKDYLGLYRYQGKSNAMRYADYIASILRPLSVKDSVWYEIEDTSFDTYTRHNKVT